MRWAAYPTAWRPTSRRFWRTAAEAASVLGVSPGRVSQLIGAGKLKARRDGRSTWVTRASVEEYRATPRKAGRPAAAPAEAMEG